MQRIKKLFRFCMLIKNNNDFPHWMPVDAMMASVDFLIAFGAFNSYKPCTGLYFTAVTIHNYLNTAPDHRSLMCPGFFYA